MANEMRLMYVGAMLEAIKTFRDCYAASETELNKFIIETANTTLNMVERFVKKAPTVDAVEVVRCKDCKYSYFNKAHEAYLCRNMNGLTSHLKVDYFCSYGERKDNERKAD